MRLVRWPRTFLLTLLVLTLAACGSDSPHNQQRSTPAPGSSGSSGGENTLAPAAASPIAVHLQHDYESLRESHQKISDIWEGLATGKQVRCGDYPDVMSPETITSEGEATFEPLATLLHSAAIEIDQAISLWKAECAKPRANPSPDVLDRGRLGVRSAGDALNQAQKLLADLQG
jgi:hypothetical protein